jgi:hypothetical protein
MDLLNPCGFCVVDLFDYGGIRVLCFWAFCSAVGDACVFLI